MRRDDFGELVLPLTNNSNRLGMRFNFAGPADLGAQMKVISFYGCEAINELYSFDIVLSSTLSTQEIHELEKKLLGQPAALVLQATGMPTRRIAGIVGAFALTSTRQNTGEPYLHLQLVPHLWLATKRRRSRIFQEKTVEQIVSKILSEADINYRWDVLAKLSPRTYCTQYRETDYQFITRLLAEEGIYFYFEDASVAKQDAGEQLVLCDHALSYPFLPGDSSIKLQTQRGTVNGPNYPEIVLRHDKHSLADDADSVLAFSLRRGLAPKTACLMGYDFRHPRLLSRAVATLPEADTDDAIMQGTSLDAATMAIDGPLGWAQHESSAEKFPVDNQQAAIVLDQARADAYHAQGQSRSWRLLAGHAFRLRGHPFERVDGNYVVTKVMHEGVATNADGVANTATAAFTDVYHNSFACVPAEVVYRPMVPARPVVQVAQTAEVEATGSEEIHTDRYGRVKVRFHWDASATKSGEHSCWLRVAQMWGGVGFGSQFLPRAGSEVLVTFLNGDPDQPVITGCLYNGRAAPPFALPHDKSRSGFRTISTPGGQGYNELSFEDASGCEQVYLHAQRDFAIEAHRDVQMHVGRNHNVIVNGVATKVSAAHFATVHGIKNTTVHGDCTESIVGAHTSVVAGPRALSVSGPMSHNVAGASSMRVGGEYSIAVDGVMSTAVGTKKKPVELTTMVLGKHNGFATDRICYTSEREIVLACGNSRIIIGPEQIELQSPQVLVNGSDEVLLCAPGAKVALAANQVESAAQTLKLYAQGAAIELASNANINGAQVNLNCGGGMPKSDNNDEQTNERKTVHLQLHDDAMNVLGDKKYLLVAEGIKFEGTTSAQGGIELQVPQEAMSGQLTVWLDAYPEGTRLQWLVDLDEQELAPATEVKGALIRLKQLGYYAGEVTATMTPQAQAAIRYFQGDIEIATTGELDVATADKLKEMYGS